MSNRTNLETLEPRTLLAATVIQPVALADAPVIIDRTLFVAGNDSAQAVRIAQSVSTDPLDTEPWQTIKLKAGLAELGATFPTLLPVLENSVNGAGPYVRVSSLHRNWFFRTVDVDRVVVTMEGSSDLAVVSRSLRTRIHVSGGTGNDLIYGGDTRATLAGNGGKDVILGGRGHESINGNAGHDSLRGGPGNDIISGGDGDDSLFGDLGNDTIYGEAGSDGLVGGGGSDRMLGGDDVDFFKAADAFGNADYMKGGGGNDILVNADADDLFLQ